MVQIFIFFILFPNILKNFIHELFMACIFARLKSPQLDGSIRKKEKKISFNNKRNGSKYIKRGKDKKKYIYKNVALIMN